MKFLSALIVAISLAFAAQSTSAAIINLSDGNTEAEFDTTNLGQTELSVEGADQLVQHTFFVSFDGGATTANVTSLPEDAVVASNTDLDLELDTLTVVYDDPSGQGRFTIQKSTTIVGGQVGSNTADMAEVFRFDNLSDDPINFEVAYFANYDLNGSNAGDSIVMLNPNAVLQSDGGFSAEAAFATAPDTFVFGSPDVTFTGNYARTVQPGGSFVFSSNTVLVVPEPGTIALGLAGLALIGMSRDLRRHS